jgi:hypothetical protein
MYVLSQLALAGLICNVQLPPNWIIHESLDPISLYDKSLTHLDKIKKNFPFSPGAMFSYNNVSHPPALAAALKK